MRLQNEGLFSWFSLEWFKPSILRNYFIWENPLFLYLIPVVLLIFFARWLVLIKFRPRMAVAYPDSLLKRNLAFLLTFIPGLFLFTSLSLIITALARPQKTSERIEQLTEGIDIMLVMDISKSMEAQDLKPNRLEAAKKTAKNFILGRIQDRIGIVVFSGEAFSLSPLTSDYDLLRTYVNDIKFNLIEQGGTAIGSALAVGINRLKESKAASKVIILLSDGDNNAGNIEPVTAAKLASAYGIKIYTILIGKEQSEITQTDPSGYTTVTSVFVDPTTLKRIAEIGQGHFYNAASNRSLDQIFSIIDRLEKTEVKINRYKNTKDYYDIYLKWAIVFFLLWLIVKNTFLNNFLQD